jgi:hypothetical protein
LPSAEVHRIHAEWADSQPANAPTFDGEDGNLYFAQDDDFWREVEAAARRHLK